MRNANGGGGYNSHRSGYTTCVGYARKRAAHGQFSFLHSKFL